MLLQSVTGTAVTDAAVIVAGVVYFLATFALFVLGINLVFLSLLVWVRGRPERDRFTDERVIDVRSSTGDDDLPVVTVQLPIYNELYVAERVIRAASEIDYPARLLEIQVLDDSTDETAQLIAQVVDDLARGGVDIVHIRREERTGYKAGALANGLRLARGQLVAIFDADFVPPRDFLVRTVHEFDDPDVAFVQGRWGHLNRNHSAITRLQSLAIDAHFMVEQAARRHLGYWFNFNGTAGIWRVEAIRDAGGWTADTLTEDLDLSYRAHLKGWHGQFRADLNVPGELPAQMSSFRRQQHRWARGSLECARKLLPSVWRAPTSVAVKFQATAHLIAYAIHILLATIALIYPVIVLAGIRFQGYATLYGLGYVFAFTSLAPGIFFITGQRQMGRSWVRELPKIAAVTVLGSGLMLNTVRAAIQIFTRPNPEFERTAKYGLEESNLQTGSGWRRKRYQLDLDSIVFVEAGFGLYSLAAAAMAFSQRNWGIFLYAVIFALGLLGVAAITVAQWVAVRRAGPEGTESYDELMSDDVALLIMAKQPVAGASKTRLQPALSADQAAELSRCFILDAVDLCRRVAATKPGVRPHIAGTPTTAGAAFEAMAPGVAFVAQRGEGLNGRLDHVMTEALGHGFSRVIAINSDSPTLPVEVVAAAIDDLNRPEVDVVLGPAEDGGYYLIGWKQADPHLIRDVTMSTPTVLADTLAIATERGLRVELQPSWYDVDQPQDLVRLRQSVDGGQFCGPHTRRFLADEPALGMSPLEP